MVYFLGTQIKLVMAKLWFLALNAEISEVLPRLYQEYFGGCVANWTPGPYQACNVVQLKITIISSGHVYWNWNLQIVGPGQQQGVKFFENGPSTSKN